MDLHGGNVHRLFREGKQDLLDYSSNINPLGLPQKFLPYVLEHLEDWQRYPDPDYIALREKIALHNGLEKENIIVGNGASEILFLYMRALKPKKALLVAPCFAEYRRALEVVGSEIHYFELQEKESFSLNVERLLETLEEDSYDVLLLCNPNNPTGKWIPIQEMETLVLEIEKRKLQLFVDEAFIEFVENWRAETLALLKSKSVFVLRALTKFFAIPGLRLGYGISFSATLLEKMYAEKEPWSVNAIANLAGIHMLDEKEYIEKSETWIAREKEYFYEKLSSIKAVKVYPTACNFILIRLEKMSSALCKEKMLEQNILIRDASNFPFLNSHFIRLAIKDRESNERVWKALSAVVEGR